MANLPIKNSFNIRIYLIFFRELLDITISLIFKLGYFSKSFLSYYLFPSINKSKAEVHRTLNDVYYCISSYKLIIKYIYQI